MKYRAWYCEHRGTVAIGEKFAHWKAYCWYNRRCQVGEGGCKEILVTEEFILQYKGPIVGTLANAEKVS